MSDIRTVTWVKMRDRSGGIPNESATINLQGMQSADIEDRQCALVQIELPADTKTVIVDAHALMEAVRRSCGIDTTF